MANWINRDQDLRKREEKEKLDSGAHGLFGVVNGIYHKISRSKPATVFSGCQTAKMVEGYHREFELQKSKAIHISRLQTRLI